MDCFDKVGLDYYYYSNEKKMFDSAYFNITEMKRLMIMTRPTYPSDKMTFSFPRDSSKNEFIYFFNIYVKLHRQFDITLILEDSRRNFNELRK